MLIVVWILTLFTNTVMSLKINVQGKAITKLATFVSVFTIMNPVDFVKTSTAVARESGTQYARSSSGIGFYDYKEGDGAEPKMGDKISFNYKGRLAGRQGWVYGDTFPEGEEPIRMV